MLGRAWLVVLILSSAAFAGCLAKPSEDEQVETEDVSADGFIDPNETAAPDGRGQLAAFEETNRTVMTGTDAMAHMHDYWQGQTRKYVADLFVPLIPFPVAPCKKAGGGCTTGGTSPNSDTYPVGTAIADFDIPKGEPGHPALIFEGATSVELLPNYIHTVFGPSLATGDPSADLDHPNAHIFFDYMTAADEPGMFRTGGELKAGQPFIIPIKPTDADMPHQTKSLWVFRMYSDSTTVGFEMNVTITAIKGTDVVNWPPHPDLYAEKAERTIFEGPVKLESKGTADANLWGSDAGWLNPERIISWGTDKVIVDVKGLTVNSQIPPSGWVLEYHNATKPPLLGNGAQYGGRLVDGQSDGSSWHFEIDISQDFDSYDTPYGTKSRWGFRLVPTFDQAANACIDAQHTEPAGEPGVGRFIQQFLVGCQFVPWTADYTMTITGIGHSIAEETVPDAATAPSG